MSTLSRDARRHMLEAMGASRFLELSLVVRFRGQGMQWLLRPGDEVEVYGDPQGGQGRALLATIPAGLVQTLIGQHLGTAIMLNAVQASMRLSAPKPAAAQPPTPEPLSEALERSEVMLQHVRERLAEMDARITALVLGRASRKPLAKRAARKPAPPPNLDRRPAEDESAPAEPFVPVAMGARLRHYLPHVQPGDVPPPRTVGEAIGDRFFFRSRDSRERLRTERRSRTRSGGQAR